MYMFIAFTLPFILLQMLIAYYWVLPRNPIPVVFFVLICDAWEICWMFVNKYMKLLHEIITLIP